MPKLPNVESAVVAERKLRHYLFDHEHPEGAPKARFLEGFGYSVERQDELRTALLAHAVAHDINVQRVTEFGILYELIGRLASPDGRNPVVRVVWIVDHGGSVPRFVTLVPDHERNP
ncbi:MAG: hypothetical protein NW205_10475 [Hyphomicrobiaceae bacterium]|nr:hypothetical protein [Hyphomicrobiaceae bacterium]